MSNIIVSGLSAYVEEHKMPLLRDIVIGGDFLREFRLQTGIKTSARIHYLSNNVVFQDGGSCGFTASGDTSLTERLIETGQIKVNDEYCPENLLGKYAEYLVNIEAGKEDFGFEREVLSAIVDNIKDALHLAVWQGDKTSLDANLNKFDGILTIAEANTGATGVQTLTIASGTSAYSAIKEVYMAIPEKVLKMGAKIYVSPAVYREFLQDMVEKNYFHYSSADNSDPKEFVFPGTNVKVVNEYGLSGTQKILATAVDNLFYGCDIEGASEEIKLWFSNDDDLYKLKVRWNSGTQIAFPNRVVLATLS